MENNYNIVKSKHINLEAPYEKIPYNLGNLIYYILLVVITIDMFISFSACIRMGLRHEGYKPLTGYGEFLDKVYNDERMKKSYTNMVVR